MKFSEKLENILTKGRNFSLKTNFPFPHSVFLRLLLIDWLIDCIVLNAVFNSIMAASAPIHAFLEFF